MRGGGRNDPDALLQFPGHKGSKSLFYTPFPASNMVGNMSVVKLAQ